MGRRLLALPVLCFIVVMQPLLALSQTQPPTAPQPPQWPGPWWMWGDGYGWQYWWICPLMMLFMIVVFAPSSSPFGGQGATVRIVGNRRGGAQVTRHCRF